ncbi:MAG: TRAP-type transport system periplasmic protein [Thermoanaerobacteraceae bacterium]|nr:TRAP-type transport system periplasmic protein [Thermoanaerobacteraceae bacterium]
MKTIRLLCLVLITTMLLMSGCGKQQSSSQQSKEEDKVYTLKIGMVVTENDPMFKGAMRLKEGVEQRTEGKLKIEVFPSSQLGDTADLQEQAKTGANVAVITDTGRLADVVKEIGILGAPYIADNYDEARKIVMSDLFKEWEKKLEDNGYKVLSFNWYQGDRHFFTNKPIKTPSDLKGLRIRTPGSPVWQKSIAAMGATPTDLAWGEVYPGLQQKVIDGAEAQYPAAFGARLYEVTKYVTKTGHFQLLTGLVTGTKWFNSLPEEYQAILIEESIKAGDYASQLTIESLDEIEKEMENKGVQISKIDVTPFKQATEKVYDELGYSELRKQINNILGK